MRMSELFNEEIAKAKRIATIFTENTDTYCISVGAVSESFADKVAFFLPETWRITNTDPERGNKNCLLLTIASHNE